MSSEPSCTGRWVPFYRHQSEYFSCLLTNYSYFYNHVSPTPFLVLSFTFLSVLPPTTFNLPCLCFSFFLVPLLTAFLFLCPFIRHFFSLSISTLQNIICFKTNVLDLQKIHFLVFFLLHCLCIFGSVQWALTGCWPNGFWNFYRT